MHRLLVLGECRGAHVFFNASQPSTLVSQPSSSDNLSEELVMPGDSEEMAQFESVAMASAQYCITCSIPFLSVHIPSKAFLENLYNRFVQQVSPLVFVHTWYFLCVCLCVIDLPLIWRYGNQPRPNPWKRPQFSPCSIAVQGCFSQL